MARKLKAEGAIPVGSVAVPITRTNHELTSFIKMNELPTGFYTQSRIFCFLPLPVETTLPLTQNNITQHTVIPAAVVIRFVVFIETNQTLSVIFYHKTSIYMQW
jgi:hypothetical protein